MACERFREAISARLDGEELGVSEDALEHHLGSCRECRAYAEEAVELNRLVRVSEAPEIPDQTESILRALHPSEVDWSRRRWRVVLAASGVAKLAAAVPALVAGLDGGASLHTVRELAAWETALAVALLLAAWRPVRALGLFPLVGVAVVVMISVSVVDLAAGQASLAGELHHLIEMAGVVALWRLAGPIRPTRAVTA